jgi:hypothetical protein
MKLPSPGSQDLTDLLGWMAVALLVLALVNGLKKVVPLSPQPDPNFVLDTNRP